MLFPLAAGYDSVYGLLRKAWRRLARPNTTQRISDVSATFDTKAEAQRWAAELEGDMSRARFVDVREAEATSLATALERYELEVTESKKGAKRERVRLKKWLESK